MEETDSSPMVRWLHPKPLYEIPVGVKGNFAEMNLRGFRLGNVGTEEVIPKDGLFLVVDAGEQVMDGFILIEKIEGSECGIRWFVSSNCRFQQVVPVRYADRSASQNLPSPPYRHLL